MISALKTHSTSNVPAPLAEIPKQPTLLEEVLAPLSAFLAAASDKATSLGVKPPEEGARISRWMPCITGPDATTIDEGGEQHPLAMLTKLFLTHSLGENLGDLFSRSVEHYFCKETLIRETSPLLPEERMKELWELNHDEDANIACSVWRDAAGEISVLCEAKPQ